MNGEPVAHPCTPWRGGVQHRGSAMIREAMRRAVDVVVVGGGAFGLAMSHALTQRAIDHVVIERGEVGHAWRAERWDSLRLLTPNWMCRLPGHAYDGCDPDGYMVQPTSPVSLPATRSARVHRCCRTPRCSA